MMTEREKDVAGRVLGSFFWSRSFLFCGGLLVGFLLRGLGALLGFGALRDFARFAVVLYGAPHIPAGYRAVGAPAFAEDG
jgi:hypothetical protein